MPSTFLGSRWVPHYEIKRICNARCHKGVGELWVEWQGYDQSQNGWVARSSLLQDVPHLVHAFEANPSVFKARKSAPMRASTAVRDSVLPPPPRPLPHYWVFEQPQHSELDEGEVARRAVLVEAVATHCHARLWKHA